MSRHFFGSFSLNLQRQPQRDDALIETLYRSLFCIRKVEERIVEIYATDKIKSPVHLSIGQEAPSVALCAALRPTDIVFGTYRGHALYLAKGGDLKAMVAELFGKASGCGRGKAGSMHLSWRPTGMMGTSAIVGTTLPHAVGYALAVRMRSEDTVVAVCFGDGAMEEGVFHESINFAALRRLPVLFVCENNLYAIHTPLGRRVLEPNYCARAETYGVKTAKVRANDVLETYSLVRKVAEEMRSGASGPWFIEVETYRWREHVGPGEDWHLGYRTLEEGKRWMAADQVARLAAMLPAATRERIEKNTLAEIDSAFRYAEEAPFPDPEQLYTDVVAS